MLLRDVTVQSYPICPHVWHRTRYIRAGSEHHSFPDEYGHETPRPVHHRKHSKVSWLRLSTHHLLLWRRPERQTDHQKLSGVSEETAARCAQTRGDWKEIEENDNKWNWLHLCFEFHFQITIVKLVLNQTKKKKKQQKDTEPKREEANTRRWALCTSGSDADTCAAWIFCQSLSEAELSHFQNILLASLLCGS